MNPGTLSHRITLKECVAGQDTIGQPINTWADVATVWASILHQKGIEAIKAGADTSIVQASIRIRYRVGITAAMRVHYGSTVYQIKAVLPHGKEHIDLVCEVINVAS
jgi:SPP1 family predicted phage head-tail adaptor